MHRILIYVFGGVIRASAALWLVQLAAGQPAVFASIAGRAATADGRGLRAIISLQARAFATTGPIPPPAQHAFTDANGAFQFARVIPGKYVLCVQPAAGQGQTPDQYFVDTCEWNALVYPVQLAGGQSQTGVTLVVPQGVPLQVNVNDPGGLLASTPNGPTPPNQPAIDRQLQLFLKTPDHLVHPIPVKARSSAGRNYSILIPKGMAMALAVRSPQLTVQDSGGHPISTDVPVAAAGNAAAPPIVLTVRGGRP